jgi:hypothetical protein
LRADCCGRLVFDLLTFAGASAAATAQGNAPDQSDDAIKQIDQQEIVKVVPISQVKQAKPDPPPPTPPPISELVRAARAGAFTRRARVAPAPTTGFLAGLIGRLRIPPTSPPEETRGLIDHV